MNRNRLIIGVAGALVVALLASAFVYRQYKLQTPKAVVSQYIVVAADPLQVGERVDAANLKLIAWPGDRPVPGMFTKIEDCAGRALITPVVTNEPILDSKLAPRQAGAGLPATIPEGMRALSVAVNDVVGVAGFVIPGTTVDVLVTGTLPAAKGGSDNNITRTILEDVRVLAAGQKIEQDKDGKPVNVPVVTLLVNPEEAVKLAMASTEGKIQLALRNTIDTKITDPAPVLQAVLFEGIAQPQAPRRIVKGKPLPPPPPYQIEIISGDKRTTKSFANEGQF